MSELNIALNKKQSNFWTTLFNPDGTIRDTQYDEFALWGGYASGKTMVLLLAMYTICSIYPKVNAIIIRETYSQLDDTIIADFTKMFGGKGYSLKVGKKEAHFPNGSIIKFRAFDMPEKILGGNIDLILVSQAEQIPPDLFIELFGRQRGQTSLPRKLLFTEGNPSECWAKKRYIESQLNSNIFYLHLTTFDNEKFLAKHNPKYIPNLIANLTESQVKRQLYGDWASHEESVFSSFIESINVIDPFKIPDTYRKAVGGDYGYRNPATFVWGCTDYDHNVYLFDEWYETGASVDIISIQAKRHGALPVSYDFSTKRPDRDGKSVWTELLDRGVNLIPSNKDELRNISEVNRMFKTKRLFITKNCVNLLREIRNYKWKKIRFGESSSPKEEPIDKDNHAIDAMLYLISFLVDLKSKDPAMPDYKSTLKYKLLNDKAKDILSIA